MSCFGAFGSGSFGSTPLGAGPAQPAITAVQLELNSVVVTLVDIEVVVDPIDLDPLDAAAWELRLGAIPSVTGATLPLVQSVVRESDDSVRVYFDAVCTPGQAYEIVYLPVEDEDCGVTGLASFTGFGLPVLMSPVVGTQLLGRYDLANPSLQADAQGNVVELGTLQIDSTGDLQNETGIPYLRKRILRRYTTQRGSILHLPNYGLTLPMKKNLTLSEQLRMQSEAVSQCRQEPDVLSASVVITTPALGTIVLFTRIKTSNGDVDEFSTRLGGT